MQNKKQNKLNPIVVAEELMNENKMIVLGNTLYIYDGITSYKECPDYGPVSELLEEKYDKEILTLDLYKKVYEYLCVLPKLKVKEDEVNKQPAYCIPCKNGLYDCINKEFIDDASEYNIIYSLNMEYKEDTENNMSAYNFILRMCKTAEDVEMLLDFMAYCLTNDNRFQKALFIVGKPGTGKSELVKLLTHMLGLDITSGLEPVELTAQFRLNRIVGKTCNICSEVTEDVDSKQLAKPLKLISGDPTEINVKYEAGFNYIPIVKFLFSGNSIPSGMFDEYGAMDRRLMAMEVADREVKTNIDLTDELKQGAQLLFNKLIKRLKIIYEKKKLYESPYSDGVKQFYKGGSVALKEFIKENLIYRVGSRIKTSELMPLYNEFLENRNKKPITITQFNKLLKKSELFEIKKGHQSANFIIDYDIKLKVKAKQLK